MIRLLFFSNTKDLPQGNQTAKWPLTSQYRVRSLVLILWFTHFRAYPVIRRSELAQGGVVYTIGQSLIEEGGEAWRSHNIRRGQPLRKRAKRGVKLLRSHGSDAGDRFLQN